MNCPYELFTMQHRCVGIRNSHDKSFAVGLSAEIVVCVCTNLAFGGTTVVKRRHTSGIVLTELIDLAVASLEDDFLTTEAVCEGLKDVYLRDDDEARSLNAVFLNISFLIRALPVYSNSSARIGLVVTNLTLPLLLVHGTSNTFFLQERLDRVNRRLDS